MILAIDIGNSWVKAGLFRGKILEFRTRKPSQSLLTHGNWRDFWKQIVVDSRLSDLTIELAAYSCVNTKILPSFIEWISAQFYNIPFTPINADIYPYGIDYENPESLGSDRLADAYGGYRRYGGPIIVVDCGTAVTFNVVDESGKFLGGAIAPGWSLMIKSLAGGTSNLPMVKLEFPPDALGKSTVDGILAGVTFGLVDLIDGLISRIEKKMDCKIRAIATGGNGHLLRIRSRKIEQYLPDLTLEGIAGLAANKESSR